ncbi:hypothetical protein Landi51_09811 [Colletotrichum acutatum]
MDQNEPTEKCLAVQAFRNVAGPPREHRKLLMWMNVNFAVDHDIIEATVRTLVVPAAPDDIRQLQGRAAATANPTFVAVVNLTLAVVVIPAPAAATKTIRHICYSH